MKLTIHCSIVAAFFCKMPGALGATDSKAGDPDMKTLLRQRIEQDKRASCIVAGVIDKTGSKVVSYGNRSDSVPALAGAGALRSTVSDLLKFLAANLGLTKFGLWPAMQLAQMPRHDAGSPDMAIALCWHIAKSAAGNVIWHNDETGGYHFVYRLQPHSPTRRRSPGQLRRFDRRSRVSSSRSR